MPTTYTIDQTVTPASSNSSANITISQTADKTVEMSSPYNRNRLQKKITTNIPVIFYNTDSKPVIFYERPILTPSNIEQTVADIFYLDLGDYHNDERRTAQSFQLENPAICTAVDIMEGQVISPFGGSGNWTVRIETDYLGLPSGELAHTNASVVVIPPGENTVVTCTFASSFRLCGLTIYWLVIDCQGQLTDHSYFLAGTTTASSYPDGGLATKLNGIWSSSSYYDLYFKIYLSADTTIKPIVFYLRESLVAIYRFIKIGIRKFINNTVLSLVTSYTIGKNIAQTITMAFGAIVPTSVAITISENITMTDTSLDTDNDQDATDNGAIEPTATGSSANITISQTANKTNTIGTEYSTVVA